MRILKRFFTMFSVLGVLSVLQAQDIDFYTAMGSGSSDWSYVETAEDKENLSFYSRLFESQARSIAATASDATIPRCFHFIWLGPAEIPEEDMDTLSQWVSRHPDWQVKLWTDRDRKLDVPKVQVVVFKEYPFKELSYEFYEADNYGEKSQILRYGILLNEGGVYIDHDVECRQAFDPLICRYDFFAGLEPLGPTYMSSSIYPSTSVIGARKGHPILKSAVHWLSKNWDFLGVAYPGAAEECVVSRINHRSCAALEQGVKQAAALGDNKDIVFPSSYFNGKVKEKAVFATHSHLGTWHKKVYPLEKKIERYSLEIKKKNGLLEILIYVLSAIQLGLIALLVVFWSFMKKSERRKS